MSDFSYLNIERAYENIKHNLHKTPLITNNYINKLLNAKIYFKLENLQKTGSFKLRGAINKISKLSEDQKSRGIVAYSSGNHAQAVAYFANEFNVSSTIIMPEQAPFSKVSRTKELGANVILKGRTLNETSDFVNNPKSITTINPPKRAEGQSSLIDSALLSPSPTKAPPSNVPIAV